MDALSSFRDQPDTPHTPESGINHLADRAARRSPCGFPVPGPRPCRAVHRGIRPSPGRRRHQGREDPGAQPARTVTRKGSYSTAPDRGHRPGAHLRPTAPAVGPGRVRGHYNGHRPHRTRQLRPPRPDHPVATFPRSGSRVGPSLAASSANTSEPHKSPVQGWWPSSGTRQVSGAARSPSRTATLKRRCGISPSSHVGQHRRREGGEVETGMVPLMPQTSRLIARAYAFPFTRDLYLRRERA